MTPSEEVRQIFAGRPARQRTRTITKARKTESTNKTFRAFGLSGFRDGLLFRALRFRLACPRVLPAPRWVIAPVAQAGGQTSV
jgi:hypothetical protein